MAWTELITLLALLEYLVFAMLVGKARGQYGVKAPAVTGHEMFERAYRVQMNTLELLVIFLPALWLASQHFSSTWTAPLGGLFLVGPHRVCPCLRERSGQTQCRLRPEHPAHAGVAGDGLHGGIEAGLITGLIGQA
jgi:hypothetical protein